MSETLYGQRGRVASLSRTRSADDPDLIAARQTLAAAKLEKYVTEVVATAPPLTPEQLSRVAALLRPAAGRDAA